jgi:hypothetical protein
MNVGLNRTRFSATAFSGCSVPFEGTPGAEVTVRAADGGIPTIQAVCRRFNETRLHVFPGGPPAYYRPGCEEGADESTLWLMLLLRI